MVGLAAHDAAPADPTRGIEPLNGGGVRVRAPAKINLNLLVDPRGQDGYHPLDSLVVKVSFHDLIDLTPRTDGEVAFGCSGADCGPDEKNLALLAAKLLAESAGAGRRGVHVALTKNIPPGRGLGGGSSDAAAVLHALNTLWELKRDAPALTELAARLGSDVPLFLGPPASRMTSRGDRIEPIRVHPFLAVLLVPDVSCNTAEVYGSFDEHPCPRGEQLDLSLVAGSPPSQWRDRLVNQLGGAARRVCPEMAKTWDALSEALPVPVHLTGSGSALFVLCDDDREVHAVLGAAPDPFRRSCLVVRPNPW